jgi:hypothetical protein
MGNKINVHKVLVGSPIRKGHSEDLGVDARIILKCILEKYRTRWLRVGTVGRLLGTW